MMITPRASPLSPTPRTLPLLPTPRTSPLSPSTPFDIWRKNEEKIRRNLWEIKLLSILKRDLQQKRKEEEERRKKGSNKEGRRGR